MNTLIELAYDERAIENILAPDMFRPQRIVYLCPGEIVRDRTRQEKWPPFFRRRGWEPELVFLEASLFKADRILRQLVTVGEKYPDCAIDVTGGSDAALFAAGMFAAQRACQPLPIPRKKNSFLRHFRRGGLRRRSARDLLVFHRGLFLMAGGNCSPGGWTTTYCPAIFRIFDLFSTASCAFGGMA